MTGSFFGQGVRMSSRPQPTEQYDHSKLTHMGQRTWNPKDDLLLTFSLLPERGIAALRVGGGNTTSVGLGGFEHADKRNLSPVRSVMNDESGSREAFTLAPTQSTVSHLPLHSGHPPIKNGTVKRLDSRSKRPGAPRKVDSGPHPYSEALFEARQLRAQLTRTMKALAKKITQRMDCSGDLLDPHL